MILGDNPTYSDTCSTTKVVCNFFPLHHYKYSGAGRGGGVAGVGDYSFAERFSLFFRF